MSRYSTCSRGSETRTSWPPALGVRVMPEMRIVGYMSSSFLV